VRQSRRRLTLYLSLIVLAATAGTTALAASSAHTIKASDAGVRAALSYRHEGSPSAVIPLRSSDGFAKSGRAFIAQLDRFLTKTGSSH
jgi:hypothetical protein